MKGQKLNSSCCDHISCASVGHSYAIFSYCEQRLLIVGEEEEGSRPPKGGDDDDHGTDVFVYISEEKKRSSLGLPVTGVH